MKRRINVFHAKHPTEFAYTDLKDLRDMGWETITASDVAQNYAHVSCFEYDWYDSDESLCERLFYDMNTATGLFENMASQQHIKAERTHTSTSVGDIIQIDDKYYFCDDIGFTEIEIEIPKPESQIRIRKISNDPKRRHTEMTVADLRFWYADREEDPEWINSVIELLKSRGSMSDRFALYEVIEGYGVVLVVEKQQKG